MPAFRIEGGVPLSGQVQASGNKNAALPALAAALLTEKPVWVRNLPRIGDVETLLELLADLGVRIAWQGQYDVRLDASSLGLKPLNPALCRRVRGSVLLAAPLLVRRGEVDLPLPGGDRIGRRRLDTHLIALEALGAKVESKPGVLRLTAPDGLKGADILLDEASVTATENVAMAAALAKGDTIVRNAACEPHVQDLCRLLGRMGARIKGVGTNELRIRGVAELDGADTELSADYLEVASFLALAAVTGGSITVRRANPEHLRMILHQFGRLGVTATVEGPDVRVTQTEPLRVREDYLGQIPTLASSPWPAFPADLTSVALVTATQAAGNVMIHEKMFESRLFFVDQLLDMGARIVLCDPHRAVVTGPSPLYGARMTSPDIRAGMALLVAALAARGESRIDNVGQIDRGYERIEERLRALGARMERIEK